MSEVGGQPFTGEIVEEEIHYKMYMVGHKGFLLPVPTGLKDLGLDHGVGWDESSAKFISKSQGSLSLKSPSSETPVGTPWAD